MGMKEAQMFDSSEIRHAEDLIVAFETRADEVAKLMFGKRRSIHSTGRTYLCGDDKTVCYTYWDGYDAEPYDNASIEFPFDWLNKTDEELKAMYDSYWAEQDEKRRKWEEEEAKRKAEEKKAKELIRESDGFKEYQRLKEQYKEYDLA